MFREDAGAGHIAHLFQRIGDVAVVNQLHVNHLPAREQDDEGVADEEVQERVDGRAAVLRAIEVVDIGLGWHRWVVRYVP
jgi:hypothetical protein